MLLCNKDVDELRESSALKNQNKAYNPKHVKQLNKFLQSLWQESTA